MGQNLCKKNSIYIATYGWLCIQLQVGLEKGRNIIKAFFNIKMSNTEYRTFTCVIRTLILDKILK